MTPDGTLQIARDSGEPLEELRRSLEAEEAAASQVFSAELYENLTESLKRYRGEPYGDEQAGRSAITTREVMEAIQWTLPNLVRMIAAGGQIIKVEDRTGQVTLDAAHIEATLDEVLTGDNDATRLVHDLAFDGLLHKVGIAAAYWEPPTLGAPEDYSSLNAAQLQAITQDPRYQVEDISETPADPQLFPGGASYSIKARYYSDEGRVRLCVVAPEDFRISTRERSLDDARYCGRRHTMRRGEIERMFPDQAERVRDLGHSVGRILDDEFRLARWEDDGFVEHHSIESEAAHEFDVWEEYIRFDLDGDGYAELLQTWRVNDLLLSAEEVAEHPFADFHPLPVPHKFHGHSFYDILKDVQKAQTVLLRAVLDTAYLNVAPMTAVDENRVTLGDLMTRQPGGVIRVRGTPHDAVAPQQPPQVMGDGLQAMEVMAAVSEVRSGVNRNRQGLNPDSVHKTAHGADLMHSASAIREEMIGRHLAAAIEKLMGKAFRLLCRHQTLRRRVLINGELSDIDPKCWDAQARIKIVAGLGSMNRDRAVQHLSLIAAQQKEYVAAYGLNTPLVRPHHLHHTFSELVRVLGYPTPDAFVGRIGPDFQMPEQPNPAMAEAQAQQQTEAAKIAAQEREAQAKHELEVQRLEMQAQSQALNARLSAETQLTLGREKIELERQIAAEELALKERLKLAEIAASDETRDVQVGGDAG